MNGLELNKVKKSIITTCRDAFRNNLHALILGGSLDVQNYLNGWSDVDFLVVVDVLSFDAKRKVSKLKHKLEKTHECHFGINIITASEFRKPILPSVSLDGKTLQILLELSRFPMRLIYLKPGSNRHHFKPNRKDVKEYSIKNILMFLLKNRKDITNSQIKSGEELKDIVKKQMRANFIISKLSLQYFVGKTILDKREMISQCEKEFSDFSFTTLRDNILAIHAWNGINDRKVLEKMLKTNDDFIEKFSSYLLKKV